MMGDHLSCDERHEWKWLRHSLKEQNQPWPDASFVSGDYLSAHECSVWQKFSADLMLNESFVVYVRARRGQHPCQRYFAPFEFGWFSAADKDEAAAWLSNDMDSKLKRSGGKGRRITITVSEEHEAVIMGHHFDGDYLPEELTSLEQRLECMVDGYCRSILVEEAESDMQFYKRMLHLREHGPSYDPE